MKIRERIDKNVAVSARAESGVMFKDIIFGNTHDHKHTRYQLTQTTHYQNIPRIIQNVFLNTKLDADFVKNTIIQSMTDEELPIDLQTYRRPVTDFEREYDEIDCWLRKTRDGNYPVRQQALKIAEQGRKIVAFDRQLTDVWPMLNHAVAHSEQRVPLLEVEAAEVKAGIEKECSREKELTAEYDKEKDSFNQELGAKKSKLKEIARTRKDFEAIGIEDKLTLAGRETAIKQETAAKQTLLDDLLKTHAPIEEKYNIARGKMENARQASENIQKEAYHQKQALLQIERNSLEEERTKNRNQVMDAFNSWRHESDERLQMLLAEQNRADSAPKELRLWHPMADEIKQVYEQFQQLNLTEKENAAQQTSVKSQIARITTEYEMRETEIKQAHQHKQEPLEANRTQIHEQIAKINDLLAHSDGSLHKWLCENTEGRENTIGKVVDEERILYTQMLEPRLDNASDSLFGVRPNLDNFASVHRTRTPDEYRFEKKNLEQHVQQINRQLTQLPITLQEEISKLGKKYATQLNPLRQKMTLKTLTHHSSKPQKHSMKNYSFSKSHKTQKQPSVIRSLLHRRSNSMNSRKQNLQVRGLTRICLNNIVKLWMI